MQSIFSNLAIATITRARNEDEAVLLNASLAELSRLELPIYITDAGSIDSFVSSLKKQPAFNVHSEPVKGVWQQARNSLLKAAESGAEYILYTEPDKLEFFCSLFSILNTEFSVNDVGILLYSRSKKAFASFPSFQQMTETTINNCCKELMEIDADYTYGPFIMKRSIIPHLLQLPDNIEWGWRPFAFNTAKRLGYDLKHFDGDFFCPKDQREDSASERIYRMRQLQQNIKGLISSIYL